MKVANKLSRTVYETLDPIVVARVRRHQDTLAYGSEDAQHDASFEELMAEYPEHWGHVLPGKPEFHTGEFQRGVGRLIVMSGKQKKGSGRWIQFQMLFAGGEQGGGREVDAELLLDATASVFPGSNQGERDMEWYRWDLRKRGLMLAKPNRGLTAKGKREAVKLAEQLGWMDVTQEDVEQ